MADAPPPALTNLLDFLDDDGFDTPSLPSRAHPDGKVYHVASPDAEVGMRLAALSTIASKVNAKVEVSARDIARLKLDDDQEHEIIELALGDAHDQMVADGVSWQRLSRLGQYAFVFFTIGPEAANKAAEAGIFSGKAQAQNRTQRRASGKGQKTSQASTGTKSRKVKRT